MNWWVESWLMIFNLIVPMRSWVGFVALCPVVLEDVVYGVKSRFSVGVHGWGLMGDHIVFWYCRVCQSCG